MIQKQIQENETLSLIYFQITDLWKRLCEEHSKLLNLTFDEYELLLENNIDDLDKKIEDKNLVIEKIGYLDSLRSQLIHNINQQLPDTKVQDVSGLLSVMSAYEEKKDEKHLFRFNKLLIDIIEKIQTQNKKNQTFINKALLSLQEIREGASGKKKYSTYTARGSTTT